MPKKHPKPMTQFIGRKTELERLNKLSVSYKTSIVVIKGRRRVGKSRLARELGKHKNFLSLIGLPPSETITAQKERDVFSKQLANQLKTSPESFPDWFDAFEALWEYIRSVTNDKPIVILLDEISWMGSKDPSFVAHLKTWWDRLQLSYEDHPNVILILCGSVSTWIEDNIIKSSALFGRISMFINLTDLSLPESTEFLKLKGFKGSSIEYLKILSVTGGLPWYLDKIESDMTADENIKHLCFEANGAFVGEYDRIFHDLFSDKGTLYKRILDRLAEGMCDLSEIRTSLNYSHSGSLSVYMKNLTTASFISKHPHWSFKTGKIGKRTLYRLSDNYMRFYLKYMEPNLTKIEQNGYQELSLAQLPAWETMMGFQVENLLIKNRHALVKALGLASSDIVADNPYVQKPTGKIKGCQIDYLVQTYANTLYVCEFKFRKKELGMEIIDSMEEKIKRLSVPKRFGVAPVLVHVGGVSDAVIDERYFYRIIDIEDFLE